MNRVIVRAKYSVKAGIMLKPANSFVDKNVPTFDIAKQIKRNKIPEKIRNIITFFGSALNFNFKISPLCV